MESGLAWAVALLAEIGGTEAHPDSADSLARPVPITFPVWAGHPVALDYRAQICLRDHGGMHRVLDKLAGCGRVAGRRIRDGSRRMRGWLKRSDTGRPLSSDPGIVVSSNPVQDRQWILDRLVAFNESRAGPSGFTPYVILLVDRAEGRTLGGLAGMSFYDWFYVELLFIPEHLRKAGQGSEFLRCAEAEARRRNCVGIWLDTYGFQARGFYEKHGYEVFGLLDDHPRGTQRAFLRKMLG